LNEALEFYHQAMRGQACQQVAKKNIELLIKAMRNKQSLRIDDAAALCGVSVALLSALESSSGRSVGVDKVLNILDQLGLALVITDKSKARDILRGIDEV
jgi:DNA-binding transcriptional regulator YiaG